MNITKFKIWTSTLIGIFLLSSCGFKPIEFKNIDDLDIELNKKDNQAIYATITLYNPNKHSFVIKDIDIDVYLKQAFVGKLILNDTIEVKKMSDFTTKCQVNIKKENLFVAGAALLGSIGKNNLEISLKGTMDIKYLFMNREIKIDHTEKTKLN